MVQTVTRHYTGGEIFHDYGRAAHQVEHDRARLRMNEVDRDAFFARVQTRKIAALIRACRVELEHGMADFIAFAGAFDFDYACTEIREHTRRVRSGKHTGEIDDGKAIEQGRVGAGGGG